MALLRCPAQPLLGLGAVLLRSLAPQVAKTQRIGHLRIILVCFQQVQKFIFQIVIHDSTPRL